MGHLSNDESFAQPTNVFGSDATINLTITD